VADRETKLAETWAQCETKLAEKRAKYEEQVAKQQAAFDAAEHRMSEELSRVVAQQEETVRALTETLAAERAEHERTRIALAEEKAKVAELDTTTRSLKAAAATEVENMKKREAETKARLLVASTELNHMKIQECSRMARFLEARQTARVDIEKLQREKEEAETKLRRTEMARAALQLSSDAACALAAQRADEVGQLTRERDNLVAKNTTLRDNAAEDARRLAQLHERVAALEAQAREQTSPKSFFIAPPFHPVAVANSAAKSRPRRRLSAGPRCIHGDAHGVCRPCYLLETPVTLDLTADSDDDDENSQPATVVNTRKHRSGKQTGTETPKK
jgi:chromosome segregation ATPase